MSISILILAVMACVTGVNSEVATLDSLVREYCSKVSTSISWVDRHGQFGPRGFRGKTGEPGIPGGVGRQGLMNETEIREVFLQNLETVFRFMNWSAFLGERLESCSDVINKLSSLPYVKSGVFNIYQPGQGWTDVYCDLNVQGQPGRWTVFQRRMDGSVDFVRGWDDYVNGFGDDTREFWLGLEKMHRLTRSGDHELRIDMISDNGTYVTANYKHFKIGPASDNYRLHVSGYSGNASDALASPSNVFSTHNGQEFTTIDADHDQDDKANCARSWRGGWWYKDCYYSNLNGLYNENSFQGIVWRENESRQMFMINTEMKFRRVNTNPRR